MDTAGRHLHDFPQAASFNVADTPLAVGTTYAEPSFADLGSPL
jgi:ABC-2 type transport system ATP-binding protein